MIYVLHCDPNISPRLTPEDLRAILKNWMEPGHPMRPHQMGQESRRQ